MAVNAWLRNELGTGCVTTNLGGHHRALVKRYGGEYSVISGHLEFYGEELDPRYQYITLFRDPVDRVISYLFFILKNHDKNKLSEMFSWAEEFVSSEGKRLNEGFRPYISDLYANHFLLIEGWPMPGASEDEQIARSLSVIKKYAVVGLYEQMPEFLADVADLIGIPAPEKIGRVNVTKSRPSVDHISPELRQRIIELNQLDIRLYEEVVLWKKSQPARTRCPVTVSRWDKYEIPLRTHDSERVFTTQDVVNVRATLKEGAVIPCRNVMTFEVDFTLNSPVEHELEAGIHIFDGEKKLAYGANSVLMGKLFCELSAGTYRMTHYLVADLPAGQYTAGFAFAERCPNEVKQLAWYGRLCSFEVTQDTGGMSIGYAALPAEMTLETAGEGISSGRS